MKMNSVLPLLVGILLNSVTTTVSANSVLIDRLGFGLGSGTYLDIQQSYHSVSIALGYGNFNRTPRYFDLQIGGDKRTLSNQTAVYDFDANNDAGFSGIVSRLTSGDMSFYLSTNVYDQGNSFVYWAGAYQASPWFSPDKLTGSTIDFIRLNIQEVTFGYHTSNPYDLYTNSSVFVSGNFEFYGTPTAVPTPPAIWLLLSGLVVLFSKASRRHRQEQ